MRRGALLGLVLLAGCGGPDRAPAPQATQAEPAAASTPVAVAPAPVPASSSSTAPAVAPKDQPSVLESRDCRTVAKAYFDALARGDFAMAARVWDDPVIDDARLKALFDGYRKPTVTIADLQQEGAAGSSYCTVSGTLQDAENSATGPQKGQIVLKRVNDVPGATPRQLRWTIRSSTFIEKTERTG